tara:strand:+ start:266 stop:418 length:153 start_codon:yes stop_codon:yes gene_type:complete
MYSIKTNNIVYYARDIEDILSYVVENGICPSIIIYDDDVEIGSVSEYLVP